MHWYYYVDALSHGHWELLDGRLCRPDSKQWPWTSNLCTMTIVKLCWHNFTQKVHILWFLVFQIVTICLLSLPSRSSRCPRLGLRCVPFQNIFMKYFYHNLGSGRLEFDFINNFSALCINSKNFLWCSIHLKVGLIYRHWH